MRLRIRIQLVAFWSVFLTVLASGCGSETTASLPISVSVAPASASLLAGGIQVFTATVANDPATQGVTWSITGCTGGAAGCGGLTDVTSTAARYTAPATVPPGTVGVTATSVTDNSKSFKATVAITAIGASGQIAFASWRSDTGHAQIYVMNADGSGVTRLTNSPAYDDYPAWSPDGTRLAFQRDSCSGTTCSSYIYVMNADGSGVTRLSDRLGNDMNPAWSPGGAKLAFVSSRTGNEEIYVMNADGSGVTRLTHSSADNEAPAWSPDGTKLAFMSIGFGINDNFRIYVMNADGSGVTDLTPAGHTADWRPRWSPDGSMIVFEGDDAGMYRIYVMNADGSGVTRLTDFVGYQPDWSPDGSRIAITSWRDGNGEIYVMNVDGTGLTRLTNNPAPDFSPVWRP